VHIFVADIHLRPGMGDDAVRFVSWLNQIRKTASHIYILGDLFDYFYTGLEPRMQDVLTALQSPQIHLLAGNRDFLLKNMGMNSINLIRTEEQVISLYGKKVLIAHGHTLTHADRGFKLLHRYGWPVLERADKWLSAGLKDRCARFLVKSSTAIRPPHTRIDRDIAWRRGVDTVICGHLHRDAMSEDLIVLPAFFDTGRWLIWDTRGPRFSTP
jgi:UDP-2,3-diacylglucosamine hydrolase